jgi:hypothetical protein
MLPSNGGQTCNVSKLDVLALAGDLCNRLLHVNGPIGRFVRRIPLRRNNQRTLAVSRHPIHFLVVLMCNGRAILRSAAPECQS